MAAVLIGIDWGTSALRAYLLDGAGGILERRGSDHGLRNLPVGGFAQAFAQVIHGWPILPVIMCGMVGSRDGWQEVPYADASAGPVGVDDLARLLSPLDIDGAAAAFIVSGVVQRGAGGTDVMRGEETQAIALRGQGNGTFLMPGTHSKWLRMVEEKIASFRTAMTGDVFAALSGHTILTSTFGDPCGDDDAKGFRAGVLAARETQTPGDMLRRLFTIRSSVICGDMPAGQSRAFLSGLLIGAEILADDAGETVTLVGEPDLVKRYGEALDVFGVGYRTAPVDVAALGLHAIAVAAKLITGETK